MLSHISEIPNIGTKRVNLLKKLKIETIEDILHHYPKRYEIYPNIIPISQIFEGKCAICVKVNNRIYYGEKTTNILVNDGTGEITIRWFHNPYISRILKHGCEYVFWGNVTYYKDRWYMSQPEFFLSESYFPKIGSLRPTYKLTAGIKNDFLFETVLYCLSNMEEPQETLPDYIRQQYNLISKGDAIRCIHYPANYEVQEMARRSIVFEEFFRFIFYMKYQTLNRPENTNKFSIFTSPYELLDKLPYKPTNSQMNTFIEITRDFQNDTVCNRLVQGDVGSGKTLVAILSMMAAADNGVQSALMAPTEVLATQHYQEVCHCLDLIQKHSQYQPVLLTGSMTASEKKAVKNKIRNGQSLIIIGTHALIQEDVIFHNLALGIVDEQHRFGVEQRDSLVKKSAKPIHSIIMTATPIPRTTAQIIFGGIDLSVMKDKPSNRLPVQNYVVNTSNREFINRKIYEEINKGHQVYIICPMVEENGNEKKNVEGYQESFQRAFPGIPSVVLHGKMKSKEKQSAMECFSKREAVVMIATTVVEVGVNVPNATLIIIEDADMFGMLQLHQLRGRVGRGDAQSYCIFVNSKAEPNPKLQALERTNDGFQIAEEDYLLRKAGDLFGTTQSGDMGFSLADIVKDEEILKEAEAAASLMVQDIRNTIA